MKVTSFRDMETYIFSSVIMVLKEMSVPNLDFPSPIKGDDGSEWMLSVRQQPLTRSFRRNYQRTQAQRRANLEVILFAGNREYVVATYQPRQKWVKLYKRPFKVLNATPLLGKLYDAFYQNTPFTKIMYAVEAPRQRAFNRMHHGRDVPMMAEAPDYDDNEGYGEDDI